MPTLLATQELEVTSCWCGIQFAIVREFHQKCRDDGTTFYCPLGHSVVYKQTEAQRLRKELEAQKLETIRQRENFFAEQRKHEQTTKELKRTRKRVANGVCPCCHRTVSQLARHMKTKHPEFIAETTKP